MSYLDTPRIHFAGEFQVDISTINNVVGYYDTAAFTPQYQELNADGNDGGWNPDGTGIFRLVGCRITGARLDGRLITTRDEDPVIGMAIESADDRVFGKLVDLDPQQQMVSQIWGMGLRLTDGTEPRLFAGDYVPAAFTNLWQRQQQAVPHDQVLAAVYQSVLENVVWSGHSTSAVLDALRQACKDGLLSIDMNVYGYGRDPASPRYTIGRVNGTIGQQRASEPRHFVMGRQMVAATPAGNPWQPTMGFAWFQCKVDEARRTVTADFGNCLEIETAEGGFVDQGKLFLAVLKTDLAILPATVAADDVAILGAVNYLAKDWYAQTAGVQDFAYDDPWIVANIAERPLLLLTPLAGDSYTVLVAESLGGLYVRADDFVFRLDPGGKPGTVAFYASRYGKPLKGTISLFPNMGVIGVTGGQTPAGQPAGVKIPKAGLPPDGVAYPDSLPTDADGKAVLSLKAIPLNPPTPRGYIDGQLYGIGYALAGQPAGTVVNPWNYISILVFSPFEPPAQPTWHADIQPILTQYGNLYPIMSRHLVRLDCYDSVVRNLRILKLAFSLPPENPNHMPVTRDLSAAKRATILQWLDRPGPDGLPLKGEPAATAAAPRQPMATIEPIAMDLHPLQTRGKTAVLLEYRARHLAQERS
jgi:hypothetical protein